MTDVGSNPGRDEHQEPLANGSTAELLRRAGSISEEEDRIRKERRELYADIQSKWQSMKETDPDANQSDRLREALALISARDQGGNIDHIDGVVERFELLKPGIPLLYSDAGVSFAAGVVDKGVPNIKIDRDHCSPELVIPIIKPGYFSKGGEASSTDISIGVRDDFDDVIIGKDMIESIISDTIDAMAYGHTGIGRLYRSNRLTASILALQSLSEKFPDLKAFRGLEDLQSEISKKSTSMALGRRVHRSQRPSRPGKWVINPR